MATELTTLTMLETYEEAEEGFAIDC